MLYFKYLQPEIACRLQRQQQQRQPKNTHALGQFETKQTREGATEKGKREGEEKEREGAQGRQSEKGKGRARANWISL